MERGGPPKNMKNIKALTLAALTAATAFGAPGAQALNVDNDHIRLARAVASTGIEVKINPIECNLKAALGWYWAARQEMVICQENAKGGQAETYWTAEDLDTLRHEAQHLIQDCMDGQLDGSLGAVYQEPIALGKEVIGEDGIQYVINAYSEASDHIKVMEIEAFSVAAMNDPAEQTRDIAKFCF